MKEKVVRLLDPLEVGYTQEHFNLLQKKRTRAVEIMELFSSPAILFGSVARGDVHDDSDIDIIFLAPEETFMLEVPLLDKGYRLLNRELIMANPNSVPKAHIELEQNTTLTVPLFKPSLTEEEFYRFSGAIDIKDIKADRRVPGVSKKLLYIEPTPKGHIEYSILGHEVDVSKKLKIKLDIIKERVRVLSRRDRIGRTGVYLKEQIEPESSFESTWKYLSDRDPVLRRQWKIRKK